MNVPAWTQAYVEGVLQFHIDNPPDIDPDHPNATTEGEYKHLRWDMIRELKDDPFMASLPSHEAVPMLQSIRDLTALGYSNWEEAVGDLEDMWDKVNLGAHEGPLNAAVRMADRYPVEFQTKRQSKPYRRFLNIGYRLQLMRGDEYISLPVEPLGKMLGVSSMRVSDYRGFAQDEDGFLYEVAKACYSETGGIATKFRFACRLVDGVMVPLETPTPRCLLTHPRSRKPESSKT